MCLFRVVNFLISTGEGHTGGPVPAGATGRRGVATSATSWKKAPCLNPRKQHRSESGRNQIPSAGPRSSYPPLLRISICGAFWRWWVGRRGADPFATCECCSRPIQMCLVGSYNCLLMRGGAYEGACARRGDCKAGNR